MTHCLELVFLIIIKLLTWMLNIIQNAKTISGLELSDRLIFASVRQFNLPILTNDAEIIKSKLLVTIWDR